MRLDVLDIGSNTGHLLVGAAHVGSASLPAPSHKEISPWALREGVVLDRIDQISIRS